MKSAATRREFLKRSAAIGAFTIVPAHVLGGVDHIAPSEKLNIAAIGVGGMGAANINAVAATENIVALCDVDEVRAAGTFNQFPNAKRFEDFRVMLDKMHNSIDAVIVATPDHTHAVAAMEAIRHDKHVYVQKPLARTIHETRVLTRAAREHKVVTQMGNQGHSGDGIRRICEWIWDGAIGPVRQVHAWTNRPCWPQGINRPSDTPPVPETLNWDLWLGPSPQRPYHPAYVPGNWRGWVDFGTGALGDMGCHILDPVVWALKLKYPLSIQASFVTDSQNNYAHCAETYPKASIVHYKFPARGDMPPVTVHWYDGGLMPERPEELEPGRRMGEDTGGVLFVGDRGKLMCGNTASSPQLIPYDTMQAYRQPEPSIPRIKDDTGGHEMNWVRACKGQETACSDFQTAGPLSEMVVMGNLALFFPNEELMWDEAAAEIRNRPEAKAIITPSFRDGWTL
ncbi:MAG: Gfo/Idh/MocA family oxidoreductase [Planctomycetales bacterium]|nr:Gfo/Idh/MocA family oxidoreductase [Planctomycetales bacterium]